MPNSTTEMVLFRMTLVARKLKTKKIRTEDKVVVVEEGRMLCSFQKGIEKGSGWSELSPRWLGDYSKCDQGDRKESA